MQWCSCELSQSAHCIVCHVVFALQSDSIAPAEGPDEARAGHAVVFIPPLPSSAQQVCRVCHSLTHSLTCSLFCTIGVIKSCDCCVTPLK